MRPSEAAARVSGAVARLVRPERAQSYALGLGHGEHHCPVELFCFARPQYEHGPALWLATGCDTPQAADETNRERLTILNRLH